MPHQSCSYCNKRITERKIRHLGEPCFWHVFVKFIGSKKTKFQKTDPICGRCRCEVIRADLNAIRSQSTKRLSIRGTGTRPKEPGMLDVRTGTEESEMEEDGAGNEESGIVEVGTVTEESDLEVGTRTEGSEMEDIGTINEESDMIEVGTGTEESEIQEVEVCENENARREQYIELIYRDEQPLETSNDMSVPNNEESYAHESMDQSLFQDSCLDHDYSQSIMSTPRVSSIGSVPASLSSQNSTQAPSISSQGTVYIGKVPVSKATESGCFLCGNRAERKRVPGEAIRQAWMEKNVLIPTTNRTCKNHLDGNRFTFEALGMIEAQRTGVSMNSNELGDWLLHLTNDRKNSLRIDFTSKDLTDEEYKLLTGIHQADFDDLFLVLEGRMRNSSNRHPRNALAMLLMTLRLNLTQKFLAFLFNTNQQAVSEAIQSVTTLLEEFFVPLNLGLSHMSREEALQKHSRKFFNNLFEKPEGTLFITADGTYLYIDKPGDFEEQIKTFSMHKHRNLYKPMMMILPSGYLLDAPAMFYADSNNNDAQIMKYIFQSSELTKLVQEEDCLIYDRGFRDIVEGLENSGLFVYMPSLLPKGHKQFTAVEGNHSRRVTMVRWLVESVNGRLKNVFPFFKGTIKGSHSEKIKPFFRIACALINKYFKPLFMDAEKHNRIAEVVLARIDLPNALQSRIEAMGYLRMTAKWREASDETVLDFPRLSWQDLEDFTLGSYQLFIAAKYNKEHVKINSRYTILLHRDASNLIRIRIQSRFIKSKKHSGWIEYDSMIEGHMAITGWYCTCKAGARIIGSCSHVVAVIRYLSFDRYQPPPTDVRSRKALEIIDAATALMEYEDSSSESEIELEDTYPETDSQEELLSL